MVELIHLATLVHDDSVDHSVLRRGMPTINALFSHQVSVIMGDYLYSRAVIELVRLGDLEPLRILWRVTNEMTVGEMRQLLAHDRAGVLGGGVRPADQGQDRVAPLRRLRDRRPPRPGRAAPGAAASSATGSGMAFQIVDDLLDYTGDDVGHRQAGRASTSGSTRSRCR